MERLIVVSDNHGYIQPLLDIRETNQDAKAFLHCGDSELRPELLNGFVSVRGNISLFPGYGHTRVFAYDIKNGVHLINPGSVWRARDGKRPSYVKIDIIKQDVIVTKIEL